MPLPRLFSGSSAPRVRLVACQGSVQLATALAALQTHAQWQGGGEAQKHLLVHHLASPAGQDEEFAKCIGELAQCAQPWHGIHYLNPTTTTALLDIWRRGPEAACDELRSRLGLKQVDELHIGQNVNFEHRLLAEAFPAAERIACGDGIGLNFSRDYYRPDAPRPGVKPRITWHTRWRALQTRLGLRKPPPPDRDPLGEVASHHRYLLLPNLFDEVAKDYRLIPAAALSNVFNQFARHPQLARSADVESAAQALRAAERGVILLSSNFSETKRMTLEGEVQSYCELIREAVPAAGTAVVIKPHPRDSHEKIGALRAALAQSYRSVSVLGDAITFYAPFESIVKYYLETVPNFVAKTVTVCVSSSCLGLEYLYGCRTVMGLGEERVQRHFAPKWQALRNIHERDLIAAIEHVRQRRRAMAA